MNCRFCSVRKPIDGLTYKGQKICLNCLELNCIAASRDMEINESGISTEGDGAVSSEPGGSNQPPNCS